MYKLIWLYTSPGHKLSPTGHEFSTSGQNLWQQVVPPTGQELLLPTLTTT